MNVTGFKEAILKSKRYDVIFKLNCLSLFVNTFFESHSYGTCNIDPVRRVVRVEDISCINWCAYLNYCLKNTRSLWHQDKKKCYYNGPVLLLMVVFLINNGDHMYVVVFNLTYPQVHIIDNIKTKIVRRNVWSYTYIIKIVLHTISGENYIYRQKNQRFAINNSEDDEN
ncbi:unnamed protein product [Lactuca saligna]|uniref:Uncharacterized protein n=1 Tax=Lactuca saligna TaxID=75948 RepID=A0AA35ZUP9_LACSI|nr:unnamed protein product [Lactuca saligna]